MPIKRAKRVRVLAVPDNPEEVLAKLYPAEEDTDRVSVHSTSITVDGETISEFDELSDFPGCCGIKIVEEVGSIAPDKKEAYAAVHALYVEEGSFGDRAAAVATTSHQQVNAEAFFRANGWKEIPLGRNPNSGNQITLWILKLN